MTPLEAVVYVSSAVGAPTEAELTKLLTQARSTNQEYGVTGALLYHDGTFFQYFEGPPAGVEVVYSRIRRSPMHQGIIELMRARIDQRHFSDWSMGFTQAPRSTILQLSNAKWLSTLAVPGKDDQVPDGMALLTNFWHTSMRLR